MRLIIAGSRDLTGLFEIIDGAVKHNKLPEIKEIVSGAAKGVDQEGEYWATYQYFQDYPHQDSRISLKLFPADWEKQGKAAGPVRNKEMAEYADALLLIWDGESRGSKNMKETMLKLNKPVYKVILRKHNV